MLDFLKSIDLLRDEANDEQGTIGEYIGFYGLIITCIVGTIFFLTI